jgi:hypothetical protein
MLNETPPPRSPTELFTGCLLIQLKLHYTRQSSIAGGGRKLFGYSCTIQISANDPIVPMKEISFNYPDE